MADSWIPALVGLVALVFGVGLVVVGWGYPVTTCWGGQGVEPSCSTNYADSITAIALIAGGVAGVVFGSRRLWSVR